MNEFVEKDSQRPDVEGVVVSFVLDHFWRHVLEGSTEGIPLLAVVRLNAPAEVADLDDVAFFNEDVLGLDVPVNESLLVHVVDARADLDEEVEGGVLAQELFLPDEVEQISLRCVLKS